MTDLRPGARLFIVNLLTQCSGIVLVDQPSDRHLDEIRIAEILRAVGIGGFHRLGKAVDRLCGIGAGSAQVITFENIQNLDDVNPAR